MCTGAATHRVFEIFYMLWFQLEKHYTTGSDYWLRTRDCVVVDATTVGGVFIVSVLFVDGFVIVVAVVVGANVTVGDISPCETLNTHTTRIYACTPSGGTPWLKHT